MTKITAGWFTQTWFPDGWWQTDNQWWTEYGEVAETVQAAQYRPVTRVVRRKRLSPHVLTLIKSYLEHKLNDQSD